MTVIPPGEGGNALSALYDGSGTPVFAEALPLLSTNADGFCVVTYDRWQHPIWSGGCVDLILHITDPFDAMPEHYVEHIRACLRRGGFIAVHGPDPETVEEAVVAITAGIKVMQ